MKFQLVAIIVALGMLAVACGTDDATPTSAPTAVPTSTSQPTAIPTSTPRPEATAVPNPTTISGPAGVSLDIKDFAHQDVTIEVGTEVIWTQRDAGIPHTTTSGRPDESGSGQVWGSDILNDGDTFSHTFTQAGTFPYFCRIHPSSMQATVTVVERLEKQAPTSSPSPTPTATSVPPTPTQAPTATVSPTDTQAPTPTTAPTDTPVSTQATIQSTATPAPSPEPIPAATTAPSPPPAATATSTPEPTATIPATLVPTATPVPTPTLTPSPTPTPTATPEPTATPTLEPTSTPPAEPATFSADIVNFRHQDITAGVGTTVTWTQRDNTIHTTTSGQPGSLSGVWRSDRLSAGETFSQTFDQVGTFLYFCEIHTSMRGTVTVVQSLGAQASQASVPTQSNTGGDGYGGGGGY